MILHDPVFSDITAKFPHAKVYLVGGAVRDLMLNITPQDKDYVVTGLSVEDMESFGWEGYGESFFVYIHPATGSEVALPRIEQKTGLGYTQFQMHTSAEMTINDDLMRRDLTINAMAIDLETSLVHDPYNGSVDLMDKVLRPTSPAFMEDPVRSLRVARFMARYGDWTYHESVAQYTKTMLDNGEFNTVPPSRIHLELEKAFQTDHPSIFFKTVAELGLHHTIFGETTFAQAISIDQYVKYNPDWFITFLACCNHVDANMIKKWNIRSAETLPIVNDQAFKEVWFSNIDSVLETVSRLHLFRNNKVLELLIDIWLVRFNYSGKADSVYFHICAISKISYTDMVTADPSLECANPKDRSDVLNTYRLDKLRDILSNDTRYNK